MLGLIASVVFQSALLAGLNDTSFEKRELHSQYLKNNTSVLLLEEMYRNRSLKLSPEARKRMSWIIDDKIVDVQREHLYAAVGRYRLFMIFLADSRAAHLRDRVVNVVKLVTSDIDDIDADIRQHMSINTYFYINVPEPSVNNHYMLYYYSSTGWGSDDNYSWHYDDKAKSNIGVHYNNESNEDPY